MTGQIFLEGEVEVYDFTVENDHNFYANGVLVKNCAPPATQAALLRVVLDRTVGDLRLPDEVVILAAANPPEMAAGGWDLSPPLSNRFCHLDWKLSVEAWIDGSLNGWPSPRVTRLPENWRSEIPSQMALIASFIKAKPTTLLNVPKEETKASRGYPTPRSWTHASHFLAAIHAAARGDKNAEMDLSTRFLAGCVGEGPAIEFLNWRRDLDLPDPEELLKRPALFAEFYRKHNRGDQVFALCTSLIATFARNPTPSRWTACWDVLHQVANLAGVDIAAASAKALVPYGYAKEGYPMPVEQVIPFKRLIQETKA